MKTYHVDFFVNGEEYELDVPANKTALNIIRDMLDLTGAKEGCGAGECGACAMIVDGVLINGCLMLAPEMDGSTSRPLRVLRMRRAICLPSSSPLLTMLPCSAVTARPALLFPLPPCCVKIPIPPVRRSPIICPVTCAAAPATRELLRRSRTLPSA